ncbi:MULTISPECIES: prephenate/arogenate dehydrogenase [Planktothricoides]|uniref:Prephenate/arogenate dehydrogenase n=2 Tax=Planktothricoides raciborskii TaxID=132608 RepID=A0AAU8JA65_9CYAN|nr:MULTISPECIES: prephenate/arogenate dehydrogenase [Planktothricoides]KOR36130.1 arogenate dehydrogenase [Planktothricoides sp. SR001]MBD2544695.1 prephenate/arogenate dehydrogenase [Planktothricoides raciborskii FACHB-1370]MBD2580778.1 prephenate/arogenate dehydrogenase [Planktothricoides raciborskii FACHB-1261]
MNIGIVGLGLIGGSLGLDLRSQGHQVLGVSRRQTTCRVAKERGIVDESDVDLKLMASAEVVFICTPIALIAPTVKQLIPYLAADAIITDVGSVKMPIVEAVSPLWPNFVPGHPMAGTAETGVDAALRNLFVGRPYVLTPIATTPLNAVAMIAQLAASLGSQVYQCSPQSHDRAVAWISHLPVMVSASLLDACTQGETDPTVLELAKQLASSGFRDTSRVGGGNPELGLMMAQYNRSELLRSLYVYRNTLNDLISQIEAENWPGIQEKLARTAQERPEFVKNLN